MTVTTENSTVEYTGDGAEVYFDTGFKFLREEELVVSRRAADEEAYETLRAGVDYSVVGAAEEGGAVLLAEALPNQASLRVERVVAHVQRTSLRPKGPFSPHAHENALDAACFQLQQLGRRAEALESGAVTREVATTRFTTTFTTETVVEDTFPVSVAVGEGLAPTAVDLVRVENLTDGGAVFLAPARIHWVPYLHTFRLRHVSGLEAATQYRLTFEVATAAYISGAGGGAPVDGSTVSLWRCNEASAADGLFDDVTLEECTPFGSPGVVAGQISGARSFNGATQYFSRTAAIYGALLSDGSWTVEWWVKPAVAPAEGTTQQLMFCAGADPMGTAADVPILDLSITDALSLRIRDWSGPGAQDARGGGTLVVGAWNHIAVSRELPLGEASLFRFYVNGVDVVGFAQSIFPAQGVTGAGHTLTIGAASPFGVAFQGALDHGRLSNVVRSDAEILASYEAGL